jgi:DNA-binding PadR family transcriptional regulator
MSNDEQLIVLKEVIDFILPALAPYEFSLYLLLLRRSHLETGAHNLQIGKRTLAELFGQGTRSAKPNYQQVSDVLNNLETRGYIRVGETTREGTFYQVRLPREISEIRSKFVVEASIIARDYFNDPDGRREIFERDQWTCQYCGEQLRPETATLDHFIPQCKGGQGTKENLRGCCLICNSLKSGKTYEEAAPLLLESVRTRKTRAAQSATAKST